ncbi:MAG: tRNA (adenosine(37)-N6)-dimethylallyltransferase MiaA [Acidimicrobiia bacterium]
MLVVVGPTAAGKSVVALEVAERIGARILSLDSMQVYRGMDIGTAKPSEDDRSRVPHSMIDLVDPSIEYTVREFQREARSVIEASTQPIVLVGGSGLHMRAVLDPMEFLPTDPQLRRELEQVEPAALVAELLAADPDSGQQVDLDNVRRLIRAVEVLRLTGRTPMTISRDPSRLAISRYESHYPCRIIGLDPGDELAARIDARLKEMMEQGLVEEVAGLVGRMGRTASKAVGYAQLAPVVEGDISLEQGLDDSRRATVALARRQRSWFRRDPRVQWLDPLRDDAVAAVMESA